jgi:hypothetical protein
MPLYDARNNNAYEPYTITRRYFETPNPGMTSETDQIILLNFRHLYQEHQDLLKRVRFMQYLAGTGWLIVLGLSIWLLVLYRGM